MEQVQMEGSRKITRKMDFYNLDAIIAVGYRVNSKKQLHLDDGQLPF
ncbi:MAG: RhuM family protein [Holdemanella porci]|nr:RhuM family protein [Holdemanella sp.]MDY5474878.1 RhuM family protein [Holdemanella porci]